MSFETAFKNINDSLSQESANFKKMSKIVFFLFSYILIKSYSELTNECS